MNDYRVTEEKGRGGGGVEADEEIDALDSQQSGLKVIISDIKASKTIFCKPVCHLLKHMHKSTV